jgi:hypothetical protein
VHGITYALIPTCPHVSFTCFFFVQVSRLDDALLKIQLAGILLDMAHRRNDDGDEDSSNGEEAAAATAPAGRAGGAPPRSNSSSSSSAGAGGSYHSCGGSFAALEAAAVLGPGQAVNWKDGVVVDASSGERRKLTEVELESLRKERARMHAKLTRDRKKKLVTTLQHGVQGLELKVAEKQAQLNRALALSGAVSGSGGSGGRSSGGSSDGADGSGGSSVASPDRMMSPPVPAAPEPAAHQQQHQEQHYRQDEQLLPAATGDGGWLVTAGPARFTTQSSEGSLRPPQLGCLLLESSPSSAAPGLPAAAGLPAPLASSGEAAVAAAPPPAASAPYSEYARYAAEMWHAARSAAAAEYQPAPWDYHQVKSPPPYAPACAATRAFFGYAPPPALAAASPWPGPSLQAPQPQPQPSRPHPRHPQGVELAAAAWQFGSAPLPKQQPAADGPYFSVHTTG